MAERTVLVVDDEDSVRSMLVALCQMESFIAHEASDGLLALELLHGGLRPDLILLDLQMPHLDGAALVGRLKLDQRFKAIPFVVISSDVDANEVSAKLGAMRSFGKPLPMGELRAFLREFASA